MKKIILSTIIILAFSSQAISQNLDRKNSLHYVEIQEIIEKLNLPDNVHDRIISDKVNDSFSKKYSAQGTSLLDSIVRYTFPDNTMLDSVRNYKGVYSYGSNKNITILRHFH